VDRDKEKAIKRRVTFLHLAFALCSGQQLEKVSRRSLTRSWQLGDISSASFLGIEKET
jgi:hypothetical protein